MVSDIAAAPTRRGLLTSALALAGLAVAAPALAAGKWPRGPVRFYVPAGPGGGTDAVARLIGEPMQKVRRVPFVAVNAPGAGGAVAAEQVRTASPDGQTLLFYHNSLLTAYRTGAYAHDPLTEFTLVADMPVGGSYAVAVAADSPYRSMADLVAAATAKPDAVSMGVQIRGSTHFMGGLLAQDSGAQFRFVEAGSDADKLVQLQGHQIDAALINTTGTLQYVAAGKLRMLATIAGTPERDPSAPDVPSLAELGYPDALYGFDFMVLGPKGMDPATVSEIHDTLAAALADPAVSERLAKMGMPMRIEPAEDGAARLAALDARIRNTAQTLGLG